MKNEDFGYCGYFFSVINDTLFAISTINEGHNKDQLIFVNEKGRVTARVSNHEQFSPPQNIYSFNRGWQRTLSMQNKILYYHPLYNDTLFRVEKNRIIPVAVEQKIEKVPLNQRIEYTGKSFKEFADYCRNNNKYATRFYNSMRYLIIEYKIGSLQYALSNYLIYDKKNKKLSQITNDLEKGLKSKMLHFGIVNDYDGGLAFAPSYLCDNYMIMVNAGEMQGENEKNARELYRKGRFIKDTLCQCTSGTAIDMDYLKKTERFFREETNENKILLMIGKLKL